MDATARTVCRKVGRMSRLINADKLKKDILSLQDCYNGFSDAYDKACIIGVIDEQPTIEERNRWIPCSERLPEVGQDILMSVGGMYTAEGCLREDGDWCQFRWNSLLRKDMVGAWMPLPEPYMMEVENDNRE